MEPKDKEGGSGTGSGVDKSAAAERGEEEGSEPDVPVDSDLSYNVREGNYDELIRFTTRTGEPEPEGGDGDGAGGTEPTETAELSPEMRAIQQRATALAQASFLSPRPPAFP